MGDYQAKLKQIEAQIKILEPTGATVKSPAPLKHPAIPIVRPVKNLIGLFEGMKDVNGFHLKASNPDSLQAKEAREETKVRREEEIPPPPLPIKRPKVRREEEIPPPPLPIKRPKVRREEEISPPPLPIKRPAALHHKIDLKDLGDAVNQFLLSDKANALNFITALQKVSPSGKGFKLSRKKYPKQFKFSVIVDNQGNRYALYTGKEGKALGEGTFGRAKLAQNLDTHEWVVIKVLKRSSEDINRTELKHRAAIEKEMNSLKEFDSFKGHLMLEKRGATGKPVHTKDYIVQTLIKGEDLFDFIYVHKRASNPEDRLDIAIAMTKALKESFHDKNILHRDVKSENMLYDPSDGTVRFIDLGSAVNLNNVSPASQPKGPGTYTDNELHGTFTSPEIATPYDPADLSLGYRVEEPPIYSKESDIYALGHTFRQFDMPALTNLIKQMMDPDPNTRINIDTVLLHLNEMKEKLGKGGPAKKP